MIKPRSMLGEVQKKELLQLLPNEVTMDLLKDYFAVSSTRSKPRMPAEAEFTIKLAAIPDVHGKAYEELGYPLNAVKPSPDSIKDIRTTVGRYLANLFLFGFSKNMRSNIPYINKPFNKRTIGDIGDIISRLLLEEKISIKDQIDYIDREQWLAFAPTSFISPSFEYESTQPLPNVIKARDKMYEENKEALDNYSLESMLLYQEEEKKILDLAKETLSAMDTGGMDIYNSGASGSFGNNYKNVSVMRGYMPKSDNPTEFTFSTSNLTDGIKADETAEFADLAILASFSRAVGTIAGGYLTKQVNASFQHVVMDKSNISDCKTTKFYSVDITDKNKFDFHLRYMSNGKDLILLDEDELNKVVGTTIKIRSPIYCISKDYCSRCSGQQHHRMGITNIGLLLNRISSNVLNKSLKKFHDLTVHITDVDFIDRLKPL